MGFRLGALALVAAWTLTGTPAAQAQVPDACYGDDAAAVACILNEGRASLGLKRLRAHAILTEAAQRYAQRMAREGFFSHVDPQGNGPIDRLVAAGYGKRRSGRRWKAGEALGYGTQELSSPVALLSQWLASPPHRRVVLGRYKHVGVGVATAQAPLGGFPVRVYVLYAGRR